MKTAASIVLLLLLCLLFPFALLTTRIERYVLQPEPLVSALQKEQVSAQLPTLLADALAETQGDFLNTLDLPNILPLAQAIFPPRWIDTQLAALLPEAYKLLEPQTTLSDVHFLLDLSEPKEHAAQELVAVLPHEVMIDVFLKEVPEEFDFTPALASALTQRSFDADAAADERAALAEANTFFHNIQQWHIALRALIIALWTFVGLLALLLLLLHYRFRERLMTWANIMFFLPSLFALIFFLGLHYGAKTILTRALADATLPDNAHTLIVNLVGTYVDGFVTPSVVMLILLLVLSTGGFIATAVLRRRKGKSRTRKLYPARR